MELTEYLNKNNLSVLEFCRKAKIDRPKTIYDALADKRGVREQTAQKIVKATKGQVSLDEAMHPTYEVKLIDNRTVCKKKCYCPNCGEEILPMKKKAK